MRITSKAQLLAAAVLLLWFGILPAFAGGIQLQSFKYSRFVPFDPATGTDVFPRDASTATVPVPEPKRSALLAAGLALVGYRGSRR